MCDVADVTPDPAIADVLPGAQFTDAYRIAISQPLRARRAAERMMARAPRWVEALLAMRNALVTPFGLKHGPTRSDGHDVIGIFPVVSETAERLIAVTLLVLAALLGAPAAAGLF